MSVVFKKPNINDEFHQRKTLNLNQNLEKVEETIHNWKQNPFDDFECFTFVQQMTSYK